MPQLGEKVGESQTSEVYAWGDDSVAKLFKDVIPRAWIDYEAATAKAAADAGAPAPHMRGVIEIDGRPAIIYQRCEGKTLLESALAGDITPNETGAVMATLAHAIHAAQIQARVPAFRVWARAMLDRLAGRDIAADVLDAARATLETLPAGGVLCHGDLHPGNILMTPDGPVAIDWTSAVSADPLVDVARQHVGFTLMLDTTPDEDLRELASGLLAARDIIARGRRQADVAFIDTYAALTGRAPDALLDAIAPYVLVMAALRMVEPGCAPEEQARLIDYIRASAR